VTLIDKQNVETFPTESSNWCSSCSSHFQLSGVHDLLAVPELAASQMLGGEMNAFGSLHNLEDPEPRKIAELKSSLRFQGKGGRGATPIL
jgi:hypothetical protein